MAEIVGCSYGQSGWGLYTALELGMIECMEIEAPLLLHAKYIEMSQRGGMNKAQNPTHGG